MISSLFYWKLYTPRFTTQCMEVRFVTHYKPKYYLLLSWVLETIIIFHVLFEEKKTKYIHRWIMLIPNCIVNNKSLFYFTTA